MKISQKQKEQIYEIIEYAVEDMELEDVEIEYSGYRDFEIRYFKPILGQCISDIVSDIVDVLESE